MRESSIEGYRRRAVPRLDADWKCTALRGLARISSRRSTSATSSARSSFSAASGPLSTNRRPLADATSRLPDHSTTAGLPRADKGRPGADSHARSRAIAHESTGAPLVPFLRFVVTWPRPLFPLLHNSRFSSDGRWQCAFIRTRHGARIQGQRGCSSSSPTPPPAMPCCSACCSSRFHPSTSAPTKHTLE